MAEAELYQGDECPRDYTADAAITGGEVVQLRDGLAAVIPVDVANGETAAKSGGTIAPTRRHAFRRWLATGISI
jgi:hypothetical protein